MKAAIAQHLQVQESQIKSVEEWVNCLFVVVAGVGGRFVSKKVVSVKSDSELAADLSKKIESAHFRWDTNVWQKGNFCRIYLTYNGKKQGFISVSNGEFDFTQVAGFYRDAARTLAA